jgi:hypothetical protein
VSPEAGLADAGRVDGRGVRGDRHHRHGRPSRVRSARTRSSSA